MRRRSRKMSASYYWHEFGVSVLHYDSSSNDVEGYYLLSPREFAEMGINKWIAPPDERLLTDWQFSQLAMGESPSSLGFIKGEGEMSEAEEGPEVDDDEGILEKFSHLGEAMEAVLPSGDGLIERAKAFATAAHKWQFRKFNPKCTGKRPYICHPEEVARLVRLYGGSDVQIAAGWLHDTVEDTDTSLDDIEKEFGTAIMRLVADLTNQSKAYPDWPREERKKMDRLHVKHLGAEAKLIKLCDRLANVVDVRLSSDVPDDWRRKYVKESQELSCVLFDVNDEAMIALVQNIAWLWQDIVEDDVWDDK
jgi:guanosine-3',5'-bis(diphosphate) 3'-pyrophosphohydrolase